jgi:hypothetical protein
VAKWRAVRTAKPCGPGRRCYGQAFAEVQASPTGRTASSIREAREASRNSAPGRARHKPSSHCAGKAECLGFTCMPLCNLFALHARSGPWVPGRHPAFPAPSWIEEGERTKQSSGEISREDAKPCLPSERRRQPRGCRLPVTPRTHESSAPPEGRQPRSICEGGPWWRPAATRHSRRRGRARRSRRCAR